MISASFFHIWYQNNQGKQDDLLVNPEVIGSIIGVVLGVILALGVQFLLERRQRVRLTYSVITEIPFTLAKEELREKLRILYQDTPVDQLYFFRLRIANTGKKTIRNQAFTCLFPEDAAPIEPKYPEITTEPPREVGPIVKDTSVAKNNEFRYQIEVLGVSHKVQVDFLMVGKGHITLHPHFRPNQDQGQDVVFQEGDITGRPTFERELGNAIYMFVLFIGFSGVDFIGIPLGLVAVPFLLIGLRSLGTIVPVLARKLQAEGEPTFGVSNVFGESTVVISSGSGSTVTLKSPPEGRTASDTDKIGPSQLPGSLDAIASIRPDPSNSLIPPHPDMTKRESD